MKSAASPSSHCTPSRSDPGAWRDSSSGRRSRTTWWPKGCRPVTTGPRRRCRDRPGCRGPPAPVLGPVVGADGQVAGQGEVVRPRAGPAAARWTGRSQASWPSWLPDRITTSWRSWAAKAATAPVNWGWASRIFPMSGGPASISKPSPAMMKQAGPTISPSAAASSSATAVDSRGGHRREVEVADHQGAAPGPGAASSISSAMSDRGRPRVDRARCHSGGRPPAARGLAPPGSGRSLRGLRPHHRERG